MPLFLPNTIISPGFISNAEAEVNTLGWATYALTEAVTFTDTGDLVTLAAHGLDTGYAVSFSVITTTTGISINTTYYVIYVSSTQFKLASSVANAQAGTALALTTNGTGTILKSIPMTGTGGSPTVTWTRTTTSPLTDTGSFLFTKDANNRMGEGASFDFTIDSASQARVLQVNFNYILSSGTFAAGSSTTNSDIQVFLYDITNAVMIPISTSKLYSNSTTTSSPFSGYFQTAYNSTSYRLIFHTTSISASAFVLELDSIQCTKSVYVYGTPITDWTAYTPTGAWVSNSTYTGFWRRAGSDIEVSFKIALAGAPTTATLTVNLPSGITIDTTRMVSATAIDGKLGIFGGHAGATGDFIGNIGYNNTTSVVALVQNTSTAANNFVTQAVPGTFTNGDTVNGTFKVPIIGWGSTTQMSDNGGDQRVVAARAVNATATITGTLSNLTWTTVTNDTHGGFNAASSVVTYTVQSAGYYNFDAGIYITPSSTALGQTNVVAILKNAVSIAQNSTFFTATGLGGQLVSLHATANSILCNTGDAITVQVSSGSSGPTMVSSTVYNFFQIYKQAGPSAISATEFIGARYTNTAGTSIANTGEVVVPFATKDYDTHGIFVTDTATIQAAGKYRLDCTINFANSLYAAANQIIVLFYKNGAAIAYGPAISLGGAITDTMGVSASATLNLLAGDTIQCRATNSRTAGATLLLTNAGYNAFQIQRVGL